MSCWSLMSVRRSSSTWSSSSERSTWSRTTAARSDTRSARAAPCRALQRRRTPYNTAHPTGRDGQTTGTAPPPPAVLRSRRASPPRPLQRPAPATTAGCSSRQPHGSNRQTDYRPRSILPYPRWSRTCHDIPISHTTQTSAIIATTNGVRKAEFARPKVPSILFPRENDSAGIGERAAERQTWR